MKSSQVLENGGGCGGSVMMNMKYNVMKRRDVEKMTAGTTVCIDSLGGCMQVCIGHTSGDNNHSGPK